MLSIAGVLGFNSGVASSDSSSGEPVLSCMVTNPLAAVTQPGQMILVGSRNVIGLEVSLAFPGASVFTPTERGLIPQGFSLPIREIWAVGLADPYGQGRKPTVEVTVLRLPEGIPVPIRVGTTGAGSSYGTMHQSLWLELSYPPEQREERLRIIARMIRAGGESHQTSFLSALTDDQMIVMLNEQYKENQAGRFELHCRYVSHEPGYWEADLSAPPLLIEVVDQESVFDGIGTAP